MVQAVSLMGGMSHLGLEDGGAMHGVDGPALPGHSLLQLVARVELDAGGVGQDVQLDARRRGLDPDCLLLPAPCQ